MKLRQTALTVSMLLLVAVPAMALEVVLDQNGQAGLTVKVGEPTKNNDEAKTPLTDLAGCTATIDIIGDGNNAKSVVIPATSPTGGGVGVGQVTFPIANPQNITGLSGRVTCRDLSGNESPPYPVDGPMTMPLTVIVPDTIAPGTPLNLIIEVS